MPDPLVALVIAHPDWDSDMLAPLAERAAAATLVHLGHGAAGYEIVILACDDARIATLNADFRGKPQPTNVLSWPEWDLAAEADGARPAPPPPADSDDPVGLGNIALAHQTCTREAVAQGKTLDAHLSHLVVHSVLHLLGYDHVRDKDAALMEETEIAILAQIGVADPYASLAIWPD